MPSWSRKREYGYLGLLIGVLLLVVAGFMFYLATINRPRHLGSILLAVVGIIIFVIAIYTITRKERARTHIPLFSGFCLYQSENI